MLYFLRTHLTARLVEQYLYLYNYHTWFVSGLETGCHKPPQDRAGLGTGCLGAPSPVGSAEEAHLWLDTDDEHADLYKVRVLPSAAGWGKQH